MSREPSRERLLELLNYDPVKGTLTWKKQRGRVWDDDEVGTLVFRKGKSPMRLVTIDGTRYSVNRIAYIIANGNIPDCASVCNSSGDVYDLRESNLKLQVTIERSSGDLSPDQLSELFNYDPVKGTLTWKIRRGPLGPGSRAGHIVAPTVRGGQKSRMVNLGGKLVSANRIAYIVANGQVPPGKQVRNVSGDVCDLRKVNLVVPRYDPDEL